MTWEEVKNSGVGNFPALVRERMLAPDANFIRSDDGRDFTYEDYWSLSGRIANALAHHSVGVGDRVAVQVAKSVEGLAIFLACARLGAIFLPLNPAYTATEVDYFVRDAEPSLIICEPAKAGILSGMAKTVLTLDDQGGGSLAEVLQSQPSAFADAKDRLG